MSFSRGASEVQAALLSEVASESVHKLAEKAVKDLPQSSEAALEEFTEEAVSREKEALPKIVDVAYNKPANPSLPKGAT